MKANDITHPFITDVFNNHYVQAKSNDEEEKRNGQPACHDPGKHYATSLSRARKRLFKCLAK